MAHWTHIEVSELDSNKEKANSPEKPVVVEEHLLIVDLTSWCAYIIQIVLLSDGMEKHKCWILSISHTLILSKVIDISFLMDIAQRVGSNIHTVSIKIIGSSKDNQS